MNSRRRFVAAAFASATSIAVAACTLFGRDPDRLDSQFGRDAGVAAADSSESGTIDARTCVPVRPPPRAPNDGGPIEEQSFVVVLSSLALNVGKDAGGFDLDDRCTCQGEPPACRTPSKPEGICDDPGGIDNAIAGLFQDLPASKTVFDESRINQHLQDGLANLLILVQRYDGQPDDSDIDVYLVRSPGTPTDDAGSAIKPSFQGTDIFDCVKEDVAACAPTILPATPRFDGYVRDGLLVVPDARFVLSAIEGFEIPTRGTLTAKLERVRETPPSYRLTGGTLAGAMRVDSLLTALSLVKITSDASLCEGEPGIFNFVRENLCARRDIAIEAPPGSMPDCDAVSATLTFTAAPFQPGTSVPSHPATACPVSKPQDLRCDP